MICRPRRVLILLAMAILAIAGLYVFGRSIWHPLVVAVAGGSSVAERMAEIETRHPDLAGLHVGEVHLVGIKDPGYLQVYLDRRPWRRFPLTAASGTLGPKLRQGDGQIPEGFYRIDAVNPNSAFHLSLRVSYPNDEDLRRSRAAGVEDPGGDIYIHGKASSIGCLAIGDDAIEQVFYVVNKVYPRAVEIIISPVDLGERQLDAPAHADLYRRLATALAERRNWR